MLESSGRSAVALEAEERDGDGDEDAEPDIVDAFPLVDIGGDAGDDQREEPVGVERAEEVHAELAEPPAADRADHEDADGPEHDGHGDGGERDFDQRCGRTQPALPEALEERGDPDGEDHGHQVAVDGRDGGEEQRPGPGGERFAPEVEPDRREDGPVARERHVDIEPGEEGGLEDAEQRCDQRHRARQAEFVCDQRGEHGLEHEAQQVPVAPVLEGFRQPGGKQLEGEGKQRQRIRQADAARDFEAIERAGAGRPAPGGVAEIPPAEGVHGLVVLTKPQNAGGAEGGGTADDEKGNEADDQGGNDGRGFGLSCRLGLRFGFRPARALPSPAQSRSLFFR